MVEQLDTCITCKFYDPDLARAPSYFFIGCVLINQIGRNPIQINNKCLDYKRNINDEEINKKWHM